MMARKTTIEGYTVATFVPVSRYRDEGAALLDARTAADLIKQHVSHHVEIDCAVDVEAQERHECEFCGYRWTEDSGSYNGGCCDRDEENNPEEQAA